MAREIILTDDICFLKKYLRHREAKISYLVLEEDRKSSECRNYLFSLPASVEINKREIVDEKEFIRQYSAFIYKLNNENGSLLWWAMNFTNKNPLLTGLYNNIYKFLTLTKLIRNGCDENLVVIYAGNALAGHIKRWADKKGHHHLSRPILISIKSKLSFPHMLHSIPALFIFYAFLKAVVRKVVSRVLLSKIQSGFKKDYIIITQFENSSFRNDGVFYDVYFGQLCEFLKSENRAFMTCGYVSCTLKNIIRSIRKNTRGDRIYPLEYFICFGGFLKCLKDSLAGYLGRHAGFNGDMKIHGEDVAGFIKNEIDNAFSTGQVFVNLSIYYSVKGLVERMHVGKILYPFENRSWEKMILLAAREATDSIKLNGYQHASLTSKHINFILEKDEAKNIPFPDEIITMGYVTKDMMTGIFNFPKDKVKAGCALRKAFPPLKYVRDRFPGRVNRILTALASNVSEYVRATEFLDSAFADSQPYKLIIRPHPAIDFKKALRIYRPRRIKYELDGLALYDSLKACDLVIYASSTVAIDAIFLGIPVVHIELDNLSTCDPMFNVSYLKWACSNPRELIQLIENISKIDNMAFLDMQKKAREFAESYCVPVTNDAMEAFV